MQEAAKKVNDRWKDYVDRTGLTSGNPKTGWWTDVQHEALKLRGFLRVKLKGKRRLKKMFESSDRYIIKYYTKDHLTSHFIGVDCTSEPKLILDSERKGPEIFIEPAQLLRRMEGVGNLSKIYVLQRKQPDCIVID